VGGVAVPFVTSPNSSIELPRLKVPLRSQFGELLLPELIPVRPIGVVVLLFESLITLMVALRTGGAGVKVAVIVPAVPVAVPRYAYMMKHSSGFGVVSQYQEPLAAALVVIRVAGASRAVPATEISGRVVPLLSSSAVMRMSTVCPLVAVTVLLTIDVRLVALAPLDAAASSALTPTSMTGLEASAVGVPPGPWWGLVV